MITGFDQYRWMKLGGAVFIVLLFSVLVKPALASLAAIAQNNAPPSTHAHATVLRRDRVTSHGEHTRASVVDRAVMEDSRGVFEFTEPRHAFDVVGFGFLCFALLILLAALLNAAVGRSLRDPLEGGLQRKHSAVYLATLRLRI
ncbi:hypothetical protein [Acidihalobacter prosperus]|uniref:hypothetical protein n=1 Tax=Acidihalobacter prosperus TaxID=160660 RepID=UPI00056F73E9|nr:hypothetical protein [Acidihalobacter prosperus]